MTGTARLGMTTQPTREEPLMNTTAWPTTPAFEMIAFAYDGWSILRIGATPTLPLTYEATYPELPGEVFTAGSLGEIRDVVDMYRELEAEQAQEFESAAYAAWEAEQDRLCHATRHAGSVSEPYGIGCDLDRFHSLTRWEVADPFGPDTGTWTWTPGPRGTLTRWEA